MPVVSLPAPYGGQNNKDGLLTLQPVFATSLVNWIPGPGYLDARGPITTYSSNSVSDYITSIWGGSSGGVFTTFGGDIYEVNTTIGAALATGLNGNDWHGNAFQDRIILCSGLDTPQIYNGTTVTAGTYSGSGLTASDLAGSLTFKGRVYYWEASSRRFWYAAAGAFQGALSSFDLSQWTRGDGNIVSIAPLTFDGGSGPDDLIAFLFTNGEVLVYQGDDPGNTNAWQQVGAFRIGKMRGGACWAVVGSATLVATDLGVVDLARALSSGALDDSAVVGQQFGGSNFTGFLGTTEPHFRMVLDPAQRILWLLALDPNNNSSGENVLAFYGMDIESRAWFQIGGVGLGVPAGRLVTAIGSVGGKTYLGASTGGTASGRLLNGPYRIETLNAIDDYFTESPIGNGEVAYTAVQVLPLDSSNTNKLAQGIAYHMQRANLAVSGTATYAVSSDLGTGLGVLTYQPNPQTRAFNNAAAYGTRIILTTGLNSKSGVRWLGTDLLVKPGRQI